MRLRVDMYSGSLRSLRARMRARCAHQVGVEESVRVCVYSTNVRMRMNTNSGLRMQSRSRYTTFWCETATRFRYWCVRLRVHMYHECVRAVCVRVH